jgi:type III restriction enzyme
VKLQFDPNQSFQLDAVAAVTDLFDGQPQGAPEYAVINLGSMEGLFAGQERGELGVGNRLLMAEDRLRENLRAIQLRNDIEVADQAAAPEAWELFDGSAHQARPCPHFSVEMETGTGKTYVYLRHGLRAVAALRLPEVSSSSCRAWRFARASSRTSRSPRSTSERCTTT